MIHKHMYKLHIIKSSHQSKIRKICNLSVSKTALSIVYVWGQATGVKRLYYMYMYLHIYVCIYKHTQTLTHTHEINYI